MRLVHHIDRHEGLHGVYIPGMCAGGITTSYDPKKVDWEKLDALRSIGLSPWYG